MSLRNTLPFATIPEWLLEADVSDRAVRLYGILVRHADQRGTAFPSYRRLADRLRCGERSVMRAMQELVNVKALKIEERRRPEDGGQTSNLYILTPGGVSPVSGGGATDAPGPVPAQTPQEREPVERETPSVAPLRKRDPLFETLAEIEGSDLADLTKSQRGALNKAAKELRDLGVEPGEIPRRAKVFAQRFPTATLTALGLVRHWGSLNGQNGVDTRPLPEQWREAREAR